MALMILISIARLIRKPLFEGEDGNGVKVTAAEIAQAFIGTWVQCVILSACQSGKMASDAIFPRSLIF